MKAIKKSIQRQYKKQWKEKEYGIIPKKKKEKKNKE